MEIVTTTSIALSDEEKEALQTIIDARNMCVCNDCYECEACPLHVQGECIGELCEIIKRKGFKNGKNN